MDVSGGHAVCPSEPARMLGLLAIGELRSLIHSWWESQPHQGLFYMGAGTIMCSVVDDQADILRGSVTRLEPGLSDWSPG